MKKILIAFLALFPFLLQAQDTTARAAKDTAALDLARFARSIVPADAGNLEKARTLLGWLSTHFEWKATDYETRTVKQIIVRGGGNCYELARVYMALVRELNIRYRPIAEINLHRQSAERQQSAEQKVQKAGFGMSVFGFQHNDHRWVEVWDDAAGEWVPVDPSTNLFGFEQWLKGRAWFGERKTFNQETSGDMIVPFAIFVVDPVVRTQMVEDRTQEYLVRRLDLLYKGRLSRLPSWNDWKRQLALLSAVSSEAFTGKQNLHQYAAEIEKLRVIYERLRQELKQGR